MKRCTECDIRFDDGDPRSRYCSGCRKLIGILIRDADPGVTSAWAKAAELIEPAWRDALRPVGIAGGALLVLAPREHLSWLDQRYAAPAAKAAGVRRVLFIRPRPAAERLGVRA